ncbi:DUF3817 domain-containing protein [Saccharopolyspora sp. K220]|uniref:DUF3817 domain-containing protein n=1 Tax=Saccharopolyspora soli TaxID=2926618 RepID=UPI001F56A855|nr:DUF3817 domain-containing protein [Saccharopolyspora soli]MCI2418146.1 DUF3817 domain-containing protein [Saccharopolyspora soli]
MTGVRTLRIAAIAEAASLAVLLINLLTAHVRTITTLVGPLHGMAYLVTIAMTFATTAAASARWYAVIPGIGGLLVLRRIRSHSRTNEPLDPDTTGA